LIKLLQEKKSFFPRHLGIQQISNCDLSKICQKKSRTIGFKLKNRAIAKYLQNLGVIFITYHTHLGIGEGEVIFRRINPESVVAHEVLVHGDADRDGRVLELLLALHQGRCANHFLFKMYEQSVNVFAFELLITISK